jgi:hypothetical protein
MLDLKQLENKLNLALSKETKESLINWMNSVKFRESNEYYTYICIKPIVDYGFKLKEGDLVTSKELRTLPPLYRAEYTRLLNSPILKTNKL